MSRQSQGLDKEHKLANNVYKLTEGSVIPIRAGWSGNSKLPMPDLAIPFDGTLRIAELKTTSQDTERIYQEDIEDLAYWSQYMVELPVYPYFMVKFNRWKLCVIRLKRLSNWEKCVTHFKNDCPLNTRITNEGNLAVDKPEAGNDYWPSVQTIDSDYPDAKELLRTLEEDETEQPTVSKIIRQKPDFFENLGSE